MNTISNAYIVLSVADIKILLVAAQLEQKQRDSFKDSVTIVLTDLTVYTEDGYEPQIASWSLTEAAQAAATETQKLIDADDRAFYDNRFNL